MDELETVAPAFVDMAHRIVWATVATVAPDGRPRGRVLHPLWEWDGERLHGWIATGPTPTKVDALAHSPYVSITYWDATQDTCTAECAAEWAFDDQTCTEVWDRYVNAPAPVGYDPAIIPPWADGPTSPAFAVLRLTPWRVRVMAGSVMMKGEGAPLNWRA